MSHGHMAHLTNAEYADLDAADGVIDGKIHGVDLNKLSHDKDKSTRDGEWEIRDGKYYRRDYYAATVEKEKPPVEDPRDKIIADLRRLLAERDAMIAELRALLAARDRTIVELRQEITILQQTITELRSSVQVQVVEAPPVMPVMLANEKSYYVVRSERGAALLSQYGKSDILVDPTRPYPHPLEPVVPTVPTLPVYPAVYPVGFQYQQMAQFTPVQPAMVATGFQQVQHITTAAAPAVTTNVTHSGSVIKTSERQYYRAGTEEERHRLDMLDGVADGRLNGTEIQLKGGAASSIGGGMSGMTTSTTREYFRVDDEAARAKLDAMDGVMDGRYGSAEILVRGGSTSHIHSSPTAAMKSREYYRAGDASEAARLDALDGVVDGRLHGTDIVTAPRGVKAKEVRRKK